MRDAAATEGNNRLRLKVLVDLLVWTFAGFFALLLRTPAGWLELGSVVALYTLGGMVVKVSAILGFRLHRQVWRRVTIDDLLRLIVAVGVATAVLFAIGLLLNRQGTGFPRTVPLIEGMLALLGMAGARMLTRLAAEQRDRERLRPGIRVATRVVLVGAGDAGTRIGREIRRHPEAGMELVGYVDDARGKRHLTIAGARILGVISDLPRLLPLHHVDEIFITMPSAGGRETSRVLALAHEAGVSCRILPGVTQVLSGDITLAGVRDVQVEDLLRREQVEPHLPASYIESATVLVTGAGGSIGSELVRQVALLDPGRVVLFGHGENSLYEVEREIVATLPRLDSNIVVGDIRDRAKVEYVIGTYRPDVVFHAAAHKHVPMMERDPDEAVLNNVVGTRNLAEAARGAGVQRFVNVSTDKAVHPSSILGMTKSLAELIVRRAGDDAYDDQVFLSVRFGNVLGSRGSVVPVLQSQIAAGGPITITDPEMTRYFMTIPEASRLVIQAGALGVNGAVYVLDMGTPLRIVDLARDMVRLAGLGPDDIQILFTGRRPGEKLSEELFAPEERLGVTSYEHILMADSGDVLAGVSDAELDELVAAAERRNWHELERCFRGLFPDVARAVGPIDRDVRDATMPSSLRGQM
jgi:FlaA1/EpsC-like NDP-sugar epimerase